MSGGKKLDEGKLRYDLIPPGALVALAAILGYGAEKYEPDGWRKVPNAKARYTAAMMRHFEAWRLGEGADLESGHSHLGHALCNLVFLLELDRAAP